VTYPVDPDSRPQDGVPKGKLEGPTLFRSKVFEGTVRKVWVFVPAQYTPDKPACVAVFFDGQRASNPTGSIRAPQVMENLIAKKQMPVTIGIFVTPGSRGEEYSEAGGGNPNNRSVEYDSLGNKCAQLIVDEILPEVSKTYNLTKDPEGRCIGGFSSGGIAAFNVAWERPEAFGKVITCIGSFTNIRGGHVFPELVRTNDKKPIRVFLEDTLRDNPSADPKRDWHKQNELMAAALKEKGYDLKVLFADGTHSDSHGGSILPEMLGWIWRDYPDVTARPASEIKP
jgi:enterochelin esterase family protein